ncbi:MAG: aminopeptidase [Chthoniobacteraceae bacterium]|nr:aminopeptidase [Chthoniobacteraceae bacterium]
MRTSIRRFFLFAAAALSLTARAEEPFSFEKTPGQLPKDIIPRHYAIRVMPDLVAAAFSGSETIDVEVKAPVRKIVLNSLQLEIGKATLRTNSGAIALVPILDPEHQTVTLPLENELAPGRYQIEFEFRGKLNERPQGLFFTRYQSGAVEKRALATQMEATDARRMFPCWDEPVYRATFQLTATIPGALGALSNMPIEREQTIDDGRKEIAFATTPPMASYLLFFSAAEFEELRDEVDGIQLRILTTPGKREQGRYAMEATKKILPFYHHYFGTRFPLPKLDQVALNNTGASGMENWGAILYNETALLFDPATSAESTKERVFEVVAHEIAHQWFGDLVTMAWWDNLWLNEGFASWMGTKATAQFNPQWKPWLRAAGFKEHAMHLDARSTTHPIQQPIANESQAGDAFDSITYSKGQAFLRMLESWIGEEPFRDGIRRYFERHAYSSTTTADLWAALEEISHQPVAEMARGWTEQSGFPVVHVSSDSDGLRFSQRTFTIHQKSPAVRSWKIPIVLGSLTANKTRFLLEKETDTFAATGMPIKANTEDVGFYRVSYEPGLFSALLKTVNQWNEADRLNLLNDTWALVQAESVPVSAYLQLAQTVMAEESSYAVLQQIIGTYGFMDELQRDDSNGAANSPLREKFRAWASAQLRPHLARVGLKPVSGEESLTGFLRTSLIQTLGAFNDPGVLEEARTRFAGFLEKPDTLTGDLRGAILDVIGRTATEGTWETLHSLLKAEPSTEQKRNLRHAMASSPRPADAAKTLALTLTDELIPADAAHLVQSVAGYQTAVAWDFAKEHLDVLLSKVASFGTNSYVPGIFNAFNETARADELKEFARNRLPSGSAYAVAKTVDEICFKADLKRVLLPAINQWLTDAK